jgi:hypothetical protein
MNDWLWTWGGECFGYRREDRLFAYHGHQVGKIHGDEVYGPDGRYLGEIKNSRLITNISKKAWVKWSFGPVQSWAYGRYGNYGAYAMYSGFEDFPHPEDFK